MTSVYFGLTPKIFTANEYESSRRVHPSYSVLRRLAVGQHHSAAEGRKQSEVIVECKMVQDT